MVDYDLHIHSIASDGLLTPEDIFKVAFNKGLKGIAITDHDTINALSQCYGIASDYEMDFIPGIEISANYNEYEIHILGYYIDYTDKKLLDFLDRMKQTRKDRNKRMIGLLQEQGYDVYYEEIIKKMNLQDKSIGRPHIARLLIEKGYFNSVNEVFDKLLGAGKPAYISRHKVSMEEAVSVVLGSKGIPVIAHPLIDDKFIRNNDINSFIKYCTNLGVKGVEVFHTKQNEDKEKYLLNLANKFQLIITGGSDCHGELIEGKYLIGSKGISEIEIIELKKLKR